MDKFAPNITTNDKDFYNVAGEQTDDMLCCCTNLEISEEKWVS
jgi:hypothetical protein